MPPPRGRPPPRPPRCLGSAGDRHQSRERLDDHVVGGPLGGGAGGAEAAHRRVHQPRVELAQALRGKPQPGQRAGTVVFHQHVGAADQPGQGRAAVLPLEVEHHRTLAAVEAGEIGGGPTFARRPRQERPETACLVALRRLHLDHLGTQVAQHHGAERPREDARQVHDGDSAKRLRFRHARPRYRLCARGVDAVVESPESRSVNQRLRITDVVRVRLRDLGEVGSIETASRSTQEARNRGRLPVVPQPPMLAAEMPAPTSHGAAAGDRPRPARHAVGTPERVDAAALCACRERSGAP